LYFFFNIELEIVVFSTKSQAENTKSECYEAATETILAAPPSLDDDN
jgi:hypothetical protein